MLKYECGIIDGFKNHWPSDISIHTLGFMLLIYDEWFTLNNYITVKSWNSCI
jgi:hypothetical protein